MHSPPLLAWAPFYIRYILRRFSRYSALGSSPDWTSWANDGLTAMPQTAFKTAPPMPGDSGSDTARSGPHAA
jgi:hypothetical protein